MPFHWCPMETEALLMFLSAIPLVGILFKQVHAKWHGKFKKVCGLIKFHHKGHDKCCEKDEK